MDSTNQSRRVVLPLAPTEPTIAAEYISPLSRTEPRVSTTVPTLVPTPVPTTVPMSPSFETLRKGKYRIEILKDRCIGAASCAAVSPKAFKLNSDQIVEIQPTISTETDENLLLAAQSCPAMAIEVYNTETGEKIWPK